MQSWDDTLCHLANTIEPSVYCCDAPYIKLVYIDHLLFSDTRTYTVAQIAELFEPNTVLWAFHPIQPSGYEVLDATFNCVI